MKSHERTANPAKTMNYKKGQLSLLSLLPVRRACLPEKLGIWLSLPWSFHHFLKGLCDNFCKLCVFSLINWLFFWWYLFVNDLTKRGGCSLILTWKKINHHVYFSRKMAFGCHFSQHYDSSTFCDFREVESHGYVSSFSETKMYSEKSWLKCLPGKVNYKS